MHTFLVLSLKDPKKQSFYSNLIEEHGSSLITVQDSTLNTWQSADQALLFFSWTTDLLPFISQDYFYHNSQDKSLAFYCGWLASSSSGFDTLDVRTLQDEFSRENSGLIGEYVFGKLEANGSGFIRRSLSGIIPLFYAENEDCRIVSNRACLAALAQNKAPDLKLNPFFQASMMGVGTLLSNDTLFENVECLPQGTEVDLVHSSIKLTYAKKDIWYDESLHKLYLDSPKKYWDEIFEKVLFSAQVFSKVDPSVNMTLSLSGGKDSRLLFGIFLKAGLLERINRFQTNGPPFSSEVIVASMMADHYGFKHVIADNVYRSLNVSEHIPMHLFMTEGHASPYDLVQNNNRVKAVRIIGQDAALRNMAGQLPIKSADDALQWFMKAYSNWDVLNILQPKYKEFLADSFDQWFEQACRTTKDPGNLPNRHRLETRFRRWGSTTWVVANTVAFSPYLLAADHVAKAVYNVGPTIRAQEEFHFEMMRRCDPWLAVDCPFSGQEWNREMLSRVGASRGKMSTPVPKLNRPNIETEVGTYAVFKDNQKAIMDFLINNCGERLFEIVSPGSLKRIADKPINRPATPMMWCIIQSVYAQKLEKFAEAKSGQAQLSPDFIPTLEASNRIKLSDAQYKNRAFCDTLLEKSKVLEIYSNAILSILKDQLSVKDKEVARLRQKLGQVEHQREDYKLTAMSHVDSIKYKLGSALLDAFKPSRDTVLLPYRILRILKEEWGKRRSGESATT
jgi:hypothetical protein